MMPNISRNSEATFRIFLRDDATYAIEIAIPDSSPTVVSSFPSEQAAESWIARYKEQLEVAATRGRRSFRGRQARAAE